MIEKSRQKFKYLENGQSIYNEIKSISYQMKQIKQIFFILIFLILIYKRFVLAIAVFRASWRVQEVTSEKEVKFYNISRKVVLRKQLIFAIALLKKFT